MLKQLEVENIQLGQAVENLNSEIKKVCADLIDRPDLEGKRMVTLKITMAPKVDKSNGAIAVEIDHDVSSRLPGTPGMPTYALVKDDRVVVSEGDPLGENVVDRQLGIEAIQ